MALARTQTSIWSEYFQAQRSGQCYLTHPPIYCCSGGFSEIRRHGRAQGAVTRQYELCPGSRMDPVHMMVSCAAGRSHVEVIFISTTRPKDKASCSDGSSFSHLFTYDLSSVSWGITWTTKSQNHPSSLTCMPSLSRCPSSQTSLRKGGTAWWNRRRHPDSSALHTILVICLFVWISGRI